MINKLCIGTAQFGLNYGIVNKTGKVSKEETFAIFDYARKLGINTLDTASAYGDSEEVIGSYIREYGPAFDVISKISGSTNFDYDRIRITVQKSLDHLHIKQLYGCLIHNFDDFKNNKDLWESFLRLKKEGAVRKIGFSLYQPNELETLLEAKIFFDMVQFPFSVFDKRFEPYLKILKGRGVEIHSRSVFLQGLAFMDPQDLTDHFKVVSPKLEKLHALAEKTHESIYALCLTPVLLNPMIDHVVIGVDGIMQFRDNCRSAAGADRIRRFARELNELRIESEDILMPFKWPKAVQKV